MKEWENLLRRQRDQEDQQENDTPRRAGSLMEEVRDLVGETGAEPAPAKEQESETEETVVKYSDGYVRVSPVQEYYTPPDFNRRRIKKAVLILAGLCFLVLLVIALLRSGLLRFR